MKLKLFTSVLASALLAATTAYASPAKPAVCPEASAIKAGGVELAQKAQDGTWVAAVISNKYSTKDSWTFVIGKIKATDEDDATTKALAAMKSLKFTQGPFPVKVQGYEGWACAFTDNKNYPAVTVTPALGLHGASELLK